MSDIIYLFHGIVKTTIARLICIELTNNKYEHKPKK